MKFEILDNGALRCTLTQEDLEENGIVLEDFFTNTPHAREFLESLIEIAEEEVGYQAEGNMMSIQAAIMPDEDIVLTFTDNKVGGAELFEHLKSMLGTSKNPEKMLEKAPDVNDKILKEAGNKDKDAVISGDIEGYTYLVSFVSFSGVKKFCKILPLNSRAQSRLYYLNQKKQYFLWADLNNSTKGYVYEFVAASMEFARTIEKDALRKSYLDEHADIIIKKKALETLAKL